MSHWFDALARLVSRVRDRWVPRRWEARALRSPEEYRREIQRLARELEAVRAKRAREKAAFHARHTILEQYPPNGGMSLAEADRRLANLHRIREKRMLGEERAYEQQIRELEQEAQEAFDR